MNRLTALEKLKYYTQFNSFDIFNDLTWWQLRKIKKMILFALPYYNDIGKPIYWKVKFNKKIIRDNYSRKRKKMFMKSIDVYDLENSLSYNVFTGLIYNPIAFNLTWELDEAIEEHKKKRKL